MRHARLELWSRGSSFAHQRHPAVKISLALVILVSIATLKPHQWPFAAAVFLALVVMAQAARLPIGRVCLAAAVVLPFATMFALIGALAGDAERGLGIMVRAYVSALTTILLMATTSQPDLLTGLETLHAPRFLIQVMQFLYRYLLVLVEEASAMRAAATSRAGRLRAAEFRRAAAAAAVLFARSWSRANAIHQAMTARGFTGHIPRFRTLRITGGDLAFLAAIALPVIALRILAR